MELPLGDGDASCGSGKAVDENAREKAAHGPRPASSAAFAIACTELFAPMAPQAQWLRPSSSNFAAED